MEESYEAVGDRDKAIYVTMVLAEYAKRMVLFEAEGYRPPTIAKMLESEGIFCSRRGVAKVFKRRFLLRLNSHTEITRWAQVCDNLTRL